MDDSGKDPDPRSPVGRSLDRGLGALQALREAFGESVEEARDRGDLTTDRAKEILNRTFERAREATRGQESPESTAASEGEPEVVSRREFAALRRRIERIEAALGLGSSDAGERPPDADARR